MYEVFYNLKAEPFRLSPDHRFCYEHQGYARARAYMAYAFMRAEGFVMITGRPGTGKTTLIGELVESLAQDNVCTANLVCTQLEADDLLKTVAYHFGIAAEGVDKAEILQRLEVLFNRWHREGRRALLIVDEAQDLSASAMEELRLLTNIQSNGQPLLQIFLLGQPELRDLILSPPMEQVHQRIVAASHLEGLEVEEVEAYILHRLKKVGWDNDPVIQADVFPLIHKYSEGVPRRINLICSRLFLHGGVEQRHEFSLDDLRLVIDELQGENLAAGTRMSPDDFVSAEPAAQSGESSQVNLHLRAVTGDEAAVAETDDSPASISNIESVAPVEQGSEAGAKKKDHETPSRKAPKKVAGAGTADTAALVAEVAERELLDAVASDEDEQAVPLVATQQLPQSAKSELEATVEQINSDFRKIRRKAVDDTPTAEPAVQKVSAAQPLASSQAPSSKRMPPSTRRSPQGAARAARAQAVAAKNSRDQARAPRHTLQQNSVTRYLALTGLGLLGVAILFVWLPRLGVDEVVWATDTKALTPDPETADDRPGGMAPEQPVQAGQLAEPVASEARVLDADTDSVGDDVNDRGADAGAMQIAQGQPAVREAALSESTGVAFAPQKSVDDVTIDMPGGAASNPEVVEIVLPLDTSQVATTLQTSEEVAVANDLSTVSPGRVADEVKAVSEQSASALDVVDVELPSIYRVSFAFDSIVLEEVAFDVLDEVLRILDTDFDATAAITGFADRSGNAVYNLDLSWDRARVVEEYLVAAGVARHRLKVQGRGAKLGDSGTSSASKGQRLRVVQIDIQWPEG